MSAPSNILVGDARALLATLPEESIDMVLTSPPYFRLRDYDVQGQIGLEEAIDQWVDELAAVMQGVQRVLVPTGTLWLNLGDSFATHEREGAARKSLLLGPERLAMRLIADGWILRNKIVWQKASPMPCSVTDRLTCTWEPIYVFARQPSYFFDLDTIRVPHTSRPPRPHLLRGSDSPERWRGPNSGTATGIAKLKARGLVGHALGKNPGDVWRISSSSFRGGHHATFPIALAERAIQAGAPEARCARCRAPWRRTLLRAGDTARRTGLAPSCDCPPVREPSVVLDPFFGAGTTGLAAASLGRDWLGIELNPAYAAMATKRLFDARAGPSAGASARTNH